MITKLYRRAVDELRRRSILRNSLILTVALGISRALALAGAFLIPRLLGTEQYGRLNIVTAFIGLFAVFNLRGLDQVLLRMASREPDRLEELFALSVGVKTVGSLLGILCTVLAVLFTDYTRADQILIMAYSVTLYIAALQTSMQKTYQACERMEYVAYATVLTELISVPGSVLAVYYGYGVPTVLLIRFSAQFLVLALNLKWLVKFVPRPRFGRPRLDRATFRQTIDFSILDLLSALTTQIDVVMLSFLTTQSEVGIYALAQRMVLNLLMFPVAIGRSMFPAYAKRYGHGAIPTRILMRHMCLTAIIPAVALLVLTPFAEPLIRFLVGDAYAPSAPVFVLLLIYALIAFAHLPTSIFLRSCGHERKAVWIGSGAAALNIGLNLVLFRAMGLKGIAVSSILVAAFRFTATLTLSLVISARTRRRERENLPA